MIDANKSDKQLVYEIWARIGPGEKLRIMDKFPEAKNINNPEVRDYLLSRFKDRMVEVITK